MVNGEVVFEAPWQSRIFGMARVLSEQGLFSWDEFRERLIAEIAVWDKANSREIPYHYWDHFLAALTRLVDEKKLVYRDELISQEKVFTDRPHGHDH